MRRFFIIFLSIFGIICSSLALATLYFIRRGEELSSMGDREFFETNEGPFDNDWK